MEPKEANTLLATTVGKRSFQACFIIFLTQQPESCIQNRGLAESPTEMRHEALHRFIRPLPRQSKA